MTTFVAKERELAVVPSGPPRCELGNFSFSDAMSSALARTFVYVTRKHTFREVLGTGYFDEAAREYALRVWDRIEVSCGPDPATASEIVLRVIKVPTLHRVTRSDRLAQGNEREEHLRVAKGRIIDFAPVLHDGEPASKGKAA